MYDVYELYCTIPGVKDRYIGYTADIEKTKEYAGKGRGKPPAYIDIIEENGDWDHWRFRSIGQFETDHDAKVEKATRLILYPKRYTMNRQKFTQTAERAEERERHFCIEHYKKLKNSS